MFNRFPLSALHWIGFRHVALALRFFRPAAPGRPPSPELWREIHFSQPRDIAITEQKGKLPDVAPAGKGCDSAPSSTSQYIYDDAEDIRLGQLYGRDARRVVELFQRLWLKLRTLHLCRHVSKICSDLDLHT